MTPEERILAAWNAVKALRDTGYAGAQCTISLGILSDDGQPGIHVQAQARSEDEAQGVADLLSVVLRREFSAQTGWFEYNGTPPFGGSLSIYAVRDVPGCTITRDPDAKPISWVEGAYAVECSGGPATIVPKEA